MDINQFKNKLQKKGVHDGHRQRMRESIYLKGGFEGMADHEVLEYILSMFVPRKDTNPMAHELINYFGSFSAVLDASVDDLVKINGMGQRCAVFLSSFKDILKRYKENKACDIKIVSNTHDVVEFIGEKIRFLPKEELHAIFLNARGGVICSKQLGWGNTNNVAVEPKNIIQNAISLNANGVVLAHNHPSGSAEPSEEDIKFTREIFFSLFLNGIHFLDHVIISNSSHFSFKANEYIDKFLNECKNWRLGASFKCDPPKYDA